MVGNNAKRFEAKDLLVPVLGTAPGDHDHPRKGPLPLGESQRSCQPYPLVEERDLLLSVGGRLRNRHFLHRSLLSPQEPEGTFHACLQKSPLKGSFPKNSVEKGQPRPSGKFEMELFPLSAEVRQGSPKRFLLGNVDGPRQTGVALFQVDDDLQLPPQKGECSLPGTGKTLRPALSTEKGEREKNQSKKEEGLSHGFSLWALFSRRKSEKG